MKKKKIKLNNTVILNKKYNSNNTIIERMEQKILAQLNNINYILNKNKMLDLIELAGNTKKFLIRNFASGIIKGIGIGIGFSIITAFIIYLLQKIIKLNIPVISEYIADIVEIVQK